MKPWVESVSEGRPYTYQQDSAPSHKVRISSITSSETHGPIPTPDLDPLNYYVWAVTDRQVNQRPYNTKTSLKFSITRTMSKIDKDHLISDLVVKESSMLTAN